MKVEGLGFIGGGRITQILLNAILGDQNDDTKIIVSDVDLKCLEKIEKKFPKVKITTQNSDAARQEIVFIALHPPVISDVLEEIRNELKEETILISLAPKLKMKFLSENLNSHRNIIRCIPNSPSIINEGYNPISFYENFDAEFKSKVYGVFRNFGKYFETEEDKLETYAIITAMGPTYFQFQVKKLLELAEEFGLDRDESSLALKNMLGGMNSLLFDSNLEYDQIVDLIPVRPIQKAEDEILKVYDDNLKPLYEKLTSR
jgi:pyrroline-5-carboxylate reductase